MFESEYLFVPERRGERLQSLIHKSRARTELNWDTSINLKDYINEVKSNLKK
jgi:hypothetical protein